MIVLSLFDGISCARVALQRAGIPVKRYFASEVDKYAIQVSENNRKGIYHIGDVKEVSFTKRYLQHGIFGRCDITKIDLLIGGSPCQDLSIAKKNRKGLDGDKSSLFWEYVRILKETKPKRFILENVASMSKDAKAIITAELGVEPIMINDALVSAQSRKRLFRTNIPGVTLPEDRGILLKDIIEDEVDESFNVKGCALRTRPRNQTGGKRQKRIEVREDGQEIDVRKLTPVECERLQCLPDEYTSGISNSQRYKCLGNAFNVDVVAHILSFIPKK